MARDNQDEIIIIIDENIGLNSEEFEPGFPRFEIVYYSKYGIEDIDGWTFNQRHNMIDEVKDGYVSNQISNLYDEENPITKVELFYVEEDNTEGQLIQILY